MKVIDIINSSQRPFASFELVPPLKGSDVSRLYDSIEPLMQFQPHYYFLRQTVLPDFQP